MSFNGDLCRPTNGSYPDPSNQRSLGPGLDCETVLQTCPVQQFSHAHSDLMMPYLNYDRNTGPHPGEHPLVTLLLSAHNDEGVIKPGLCCWDRYEAKKTLARREVGAILRASRIHEYVERTKS